MTLLAPLAPPPPPAPELEQKAAKRPAASSEPAHTETPAEDAAQSLTEKAPESTPEEEQPEAPPERSVHVSSEQGNGLRPDESSYSSERDHVAAQQQRATQTALEAGPTAPETEGAQPSLGAQAARTEVNTPEQTRKHGEDVARPGEQRDSLSPRAAAAPPTPLQTELDPEPVLAEETPLEPGLEQDERLAQSGARAQDDWAPRVLRPMPKAPDGAEQAEQPRAATPAPAAPRVLPRPETAPRPKATPQAQVEAPLAPDPSQEPETGAGEGGKPKRPEPEPTKLSGVPVPVGARPTGGPALPDRLPEGPNTEVSTRSDPLAAWRSDVQRTLASNWTVPTEYKVYRVFGVSTVSFCVNKRGRVTQLRLTEPSGQPGLDEAALAAIPTRVEPPPEAERGSCTPHTVRFDFHP